MTRRGTAVAEAPGERTNRLVEVVLDESAAMRRGPDIEHERRIAIFDLIESNQFAPLGVSDGPFRLRLGRSEGRLLFDVEDEMGVPRASLALPLAVLRSILRDYSTICDSYLEAIRNAPRARIEAIDMGRRALHDEGAEIVRRELAAKFELDLDTARRLFTLIYALHVRA